MSDYSTEPPPDGGGGISKKVMGLPVWAWIGIAAVGAYFLFFRNGSTGSGSPGSQSVQPGSGQGTTGNISLSPGSETISISNPAPVTTSTATTTVTHAPAPAPNPQPKQTPPPKTVKKSTPVTHKSGPAPTVTVAQWTEGSTPWNSTLSGIAAHYKTTVAELLKLNPQIKNPNLIYPGEKITVP